MCKKPFHPASKDNMKRVWMAQQRDIDYKKKEEEMRLQYEKEQDLYNNRVLVAGSDSKDKLSLNFMYEAPPGVKKEQREADEAEPEYKFEWQRNAPRESFAKNNMDIRDQPFGIQVRNVRCLKCHKWGHVNTDRECPLYNSSLHSSGPSTSTNGGEGGDADAEESEKKPAKINPSELIKSMKEEQGLALKRFVYGNYGSSEQQNHLMINTDDPEVAFLNTLSLEEKKKLKKKLESLTNGKTKTKSKKKKHKKDKEHRKDKSHRKEKEHREEKKNREEKKYQKQDRSRKRDDDRHHKKQKHHRRSSRD